MSAVPFGPGIDLRRSCKLLGTMLRALCVLLGGLGRFLPCAIGANHSRLRHIGWVKSGHGLISQPRETSGNRFLDELLFLFGYLPGSVGALLRGTLLLSIVRLGLHTRFLLGVSLFLVVLICLLVLVMVVVCWCVLILPVLILEGLEIGLGFLDLGLREFGLGEKTRS